jgi:hypothetical protein
VNPSQESDLLTALTLVSDLLQDAKLEVEGGNPELGLKLVQQVRDTLAPFTKDPLQAAIDDEYEEEQEV